MTTWTRIAPARTGRLAITDREEGKNRKGVRVDATKRPG